MQERDVVAGVGVADDDRHLDVRHRQLAQVPLHLRGQCSSAGAPGGADRGRGGPFVAHGGDTLGLELADPLFVALEFREPSLDLLLEGDHLDQRVAVLATQIA